MNQVEKCLPKYFLPYEVCPDTGFKVTCCNCIFCNQNRDEWTLNYNVEFEFDDKTCHHEWMMDLFFEWYICIKCNHLRRDLATGHTFSAKVLEPEEWAKSWKLKSDLMDRNDPEPNPFARKNIILDCTASFKTAGRRRL